MRRLSGARDRELRHAEAGQIAWRYSYMRDWWYAWCRTCGRDATKQTDWLIGSGFLEPVTRQYVAPVNAQVTEHVRTYLERYPR